MCSILVGLLLEQLIHGSIAIKIALRRGSTGGQDQNVRFFCGCCMAHRSSSDHDKEWWIGYLVIKNLMGQRMRCWRWGQLVFGEELIGA